MRRLKFLPLFAMSPLLTFCAEPTPPPAPRPPPPTPAPAPPPPPVNWRDAPLTPGGWSYRVEGAMSVATFGAPQPLFTVRCDRQVPTVSLNRALPAAGAQPGTMKLMTTFGGGQWPATAPDPAQPLLTARLPVTDPLLDKLAYSLGRFRVETSGAAPLILPAWPEVARVIEDCRG